MYKLISYMGEEPKSVRKLISSEYWIDIPFAPDNTDYQAYLAWLEESPDNVPLPAENE